MRARSASEVALEISREDENREREGLNQGHTTQGAEIGRT